MEQKVLVVGLPASFVSTTVGKKIVMALTGCVLFGFVLVHMVGNLQVFLPVGPDGVHPLDHYAKLLRTSVPLLWTFRLVLLGSVGLHIWSATSLTLKSLEARPVGYRARKWEESTYASRTMRWGGALVALFVVYHLLHLTLGSVHPQFEHGQVFRNVVIGFSNPIVSGFYIVTMCALGLHLRHGVWSLLQTLGLENPRYNPIRRILANAFATVVVLGNVSIPVAILAGLVRLPA